MNFEPLLGQSIGFEWFVQFRIYTIWDCLHSDLQYCNIVVLEKILYHIHYSVSVLIQVFWTTRQQPKTRAVSPSGRYFFFLAHCHASAVVYIALKSKIVNSPNKGYLFAKSCSRFISLGYLVITCVTWGLNFNQCSC